MRDCWPFLGLQIYMGERRVQVPVPLPGGHPEGRPPPGGLPSGCPLSLSRTDRVLKESREKLVRVSERLLKLSAHEAFFLLKNSLAIPRLQYILHFSPCCLSSELLSLDEEVRRILSAVLNLRLDSGTWTRHRCR